jgi:hypothetical protein
MGMAMITLGDQYCRHSGSTVTMRCPSCGKEGTLERINEVIDISTVFNGEHYIIGQRRCPNRKCHVHIFIVLNRTSEIIDSYPAERIDFEKNNIPDNVLKTFEEAISCHADKCYKASAMMIRRTLEEICYDKESKGNDLYGRLNSLRELLVIPKELFDGMHELRLLGNDASHIEAKSYDEIGKEEVEISIEFTKEILKAIYQYQHLLSRLKSLKKTANQ